MIDMSVKETKEKRLQLEANILLKIKKFEDETGTIVESIELFHPIQMGERQNSTEMVQLLVYI